MIGNYASFSRNKKYYENIMKNSMKKNLLFAAVACFTIASVNAQTLELTEVGKAALINGTTINHQILNTNVIHLDVNVKNIGGTSQTVVVSRKLIISPSVTWQDQVCWGNSLSGTCTDTNSLTTLYNQNYQVTMLPNTIAIMNAKVEPDPIVGAPARYRYYFGTPANPYIDSVDLNITSILALKDVKKDIALSVSPNPASDNVYIKASNLEKGSFKIVDVLGNLVAADYFNGSKSVDVSDFRNGVYFIIISEEGGKSINRKLVIKH
jgi:hypothetical protein